MLMIFSAVCAVMTLAFSLASLLARRDELGRAGKAAAVSGDGYGDVELMG